MTEPDRPPTYRRPTAKVLAASFGGTPIGVAIAGAIEWVMDYYWFTGDEAVPDALTVLNFAIIPAAVTFATGYLKKVGAKDRAAVQEGRL